MLTKLFRYECKATARVLLPVYGGAALLGGFSLCLLLLQHGPTALGRLVWFRYFCDISLLLTALGLLALFLICIFVNVQRFYRLLGTQGYLMFTVPAATGQHIAARLLCSVGWTVLTLAAVGTLSWLLTLPGRQIAAEPAFVPADDWAFFFLCAAYLALLAVLGMAFGYLLLYLCMAIGAQWPQKRLFASIVSYFVIQFVMQAVAIAARLGLAVWLSRPDARLYVVELTESYAASAHPHYALLLIPPALLLAADALVWHLTRWLLGKRLNLA